ncbi:hypothetical protein B0I35DRAFT_479784 [Stachybotrys elegans]|uniref:Zn(2)-C6 fungal-type domain-containing protein n=1 Tax=Stachybotrys elegans TaxID=80388 RepID=A0A8K0WRB2_9HYPO|nr:hypothetical protein B0I35DRAFT_479784 [Stachybotrys elegans]
MSRYFHEPCREQHLRCDRTLPSCSRCVSAGHRCIKDYKFKHARHGQFHQTQQWPRTPKRLRFVHESGVNGEAIHDGAPWHEVESAASSDVEEQRPYRGNPVSQGAAVHDATASHDDHHRRGFHAYTGDEGDGSHEAFKLRPLPIQQHHFHPQHHLDPEDHAHLSRHDGPETIRPSIYTSNTTWSTTDRDEAILFRHYVQNLSKWLDLCDPQSHFESFVPSRAGSCPVLLNAIFALSARHLAHTSRYDSLASNRYHEQCLNHLIPLLDHAVTISDENLFAATIILRVLEEMDVPSLGQDAHGHLLGIHAFVAPLPAQQHNPSRRLLPRSLPTACFWVGLRQEIYSAVMNQQSVRMNLAHDGIVDRSSTPADDFTWGNRAIVHCADVLNFCFGTSDGAGDAARWEELESANRQWKACIPESFTPVFHRGRREDTTEDANAGRDVDFTSVFPETWFWKGCHVIAIQHHMLAELYLALFNPSHPRTGLRRPAAEAALSTRARSILRNLCGIGVCNQWCPPAMFTACMGIAAAGDRFQDVRDQEALLQVLRITEHDHARPTRAVRAQLRQCWGWEG